MSNALKVFIGFSALIAVLGVSLVACAISTNNDCVAQEAGLEAQYQQDQNNYANYFNKLVEMSQVPSMYVTDLEKVYKAALTARYGDGGSKAVMQFIQEKNPNVNPQLYLNVQQAIEAGRNSFEADQKTLLDKRRVYEVMLGSFPEGGFARMMGFPKRDLSRYDIVTNAATKQAFDAKSAGPINLNPR